MSTRMARYTTKVSLLVSTFMFLAGAVLMAQNDTVGSRDLDAIGPAFESRRSAQRTVMTAVTGLESDQTHQDDFRHRLYR